MNRVKILNYDMVQHLAMSKVHQLTYKGTFDFEGSDIHGKEFIFIVETPKKKNGTFGTPKTYAYLNEKEATIFKTVDSLVQHYTKNE